MRVGVKIMGTLNIRCPIIIGIQEGTIILTSAHMCGLVCSLWSKFLSGGSREVLSHGMTSGACFGSQKC